MVYIGGKTSGRIIVFSGAPQGAVPGGALLFLIHINDRTRK